MRLQKIASKLQQLESSLSPVHSLSPLPHRPSQVPSFTIEDQNHFFSNSRLPRTPQKISRSGVSHRSISQKRMQTPSNLKTKSRRSPHLEFFARSEVVQKNRNKRQRKYESDLKKRSEGSKMSVNSRVLLEKMKVKRLQQEIEKEKSDELDFGGVGRVLDRIGLFEYLKLCQEEGRR